MSASGSLESEYITLVSSEGLEFVVLRDAACASPAIRAMLDPKSSFAEARSGRCVFEDFTGVVLEKIVEYFHYWYKNQGREDVPDMEIPVELCLELLMAADFLGLDKPM
ncbi:POZ domain-containing protein [Hypomontagnella monticulosa]|nr:POZ domain-containing protein [Hypomontagnella monticulosa]